MPSSSSPSLRLELQATGEKLNLWGEDLNRVILLIEQAIAGILIKPLTGNTTLTATPYVANEARNSTIIYTAGAGLSAPPTVTVPPEPKSWHVDNRCGYPITFIAGGTSVTVPIGRQADVFSDGTGNLFMLEPIAAAASVTEAFAQSAATSAQTAMTSASTATLRRDQAETARDVAIAARDATIIARDTTLGYRDQAKVYRDQAEVFAAPPVLSPMVTQPVPGSTASLTGGALTLAVAGFLPLYPKTQKSIQFQISTVSTFTSTIYDSGTITGTALSTTVPNAQSLFTAGTTYFVRARQTDQDNFTSAWSSPTSFVFPVVPNAPVMSAPANGATNLGAQNAAITLTASAYSHPGGVVQVARRFELSADNFATVITVAGTVGQASATISSPKDVLTANTAYKVRCVDTDTNGGVATGAATTFTTTSVFRPNIGDAYLGGYFVGQVSDSGTVYDLIVSPKASGENTLPYASGSTGAAVVSDPARQSRIKGLANSNSIAAADPGTGAAKFCRGLSIGGYTDWYLPAVDELEVAYRNLKPETTSNVTTSGNGANSNSVPVGSAYSSSSPSQTAISIFKSGGSEAFTGNAHHSSTETTASNAIGIDFNNGQQFEGAKNIGRRVRAFRRVLPS